MKKIISILVIAMLMLASNEAQAVPPAENVYTSAKKDVQLQESCFVIMCEYGFAQMTANAAQSNAAQRNKFAFWQKVLSSANVKSGNSAIVFNAAFTPAGMSDLPNQMSAGDYHTTVSSSFRALLDSGYFDQLAESTNL